jgi:hypothetical protein
VGRSNRQRTDGRRRDKQQGYFAGGEQPELNELVARAGMKRLEAKNGIPHWVQPTSGSKAEPNKSWSCPNCPVVILPNTPHIVAWAEHASPDVRRHFHSHCWKIFHGTVE